MNSRGILRGRLLLSTKLLPLRYALRTWLVSAAGLGLDVVRLRWSFAKDRLRILAQTAYLIPQLLRERKILFAEARTSPEKHLDFLLRLGEAAVAVTPD